MNTFDVFRAMRWAVGLLAAIFGAYIIGFNWATIPWNHRLVALGVKRHVSAAPIAGPLAVTLGLTCMPFAISLDHYFWPWFVDWPTALLPLFLWRLRRRS